MSLFFGTDEKIAKLKVRLKYKIHFGMIRMPQLYAIYGVLLS